MSLCGLVGGYQHLKYASASFRIQVDSEVRQRAVSCMVTNGPGNTFKVHVDLCCGLVGYN